MSGTLRLPRVQAKNKDRNRSGSQEPELPGERTPGRDEIGERVAIEHTKECFAAQSVISGMLYKILPFLAWFHLQARAKRPGAVPNMRQFLSERWQRWHFRLHAASALVLQVNLSAIALRYVRERQRPA